VLIATLPVALSAQVIRGTVTDSATSEPIPAVLITLQDSTQRTLAQVRTSESGEYLLDAQGAGTVRFVIRKVGAQPSYSGYYAVPPNVDTLQVDLSTPVLGVTIATVYVAADRKGDKFNAQQLDYARQSGWRIIEPWQVAQERELSQTFDQLLRRIPLGGVRVPPVSGQSCYSATRGMNGSGTSQCLNFVVDGRLLDPDAVINPMDVHFVAYVPGIKARALYGPRAWNGVIFVATRRFGDVEKRP